VQSTETGTAYLVNTGVTVTNVASITSAADNQWNQATITAAATNTNLAATGLADGTYKVYTVDAAGNLSAASTNTVTVDGTAPTMSSAAVSADGRSIVVTYSEPVTGTLEASDWGVTLSAGTTTVTGATIGAGADANKVTLALSNTIDSTVTVTDLIYTATNGTANSVKDAAATPNNAATQTLAAVTNSSTVAADVTAPAMSSAAVSADGLSVVITYSELLTGTAEAGDYGIAVDGGYAGTITGAAVGAGADANKVTLTMSSAIPQGAAVSDIVYTATAGTANSIKDAAASPNNAATQTLAAVTNSSTVDLTAPTASVTTASIMPSGNAVVQSTETGTAYLVKSTVVVTNLASITGANDNEFNSVSISAADTPTNLAATGLVDGTYKVYAVDAAGNLSVASTNSVTIDGTGPNITAGPALASATTISLTVDENSSAGLYSATPELIGSAATMVANVSNTITVAEQASVVSTQLKIADALNNITTSVNVILGTANGDNGGANFAGTANNDFMFGFAGADTFNSAAGNDVLVGGDGADEFQFANANFTSGDTISGGADEDIIYITDAATITDAQFANVTSIGSLVLKGIRFHTTHLT